MRSCHFAKVIEQPDSDAQRSFLRIEGGVCHHSQPFHVFDSVQLQATYITDVIAGDNCGHEESTFFLVDSKFWMLLFKLICFLGYY